MVRWWTLAVVAACIAVCVYWFLAARGYWEDDAYIHLVFARSLAAGHGFQFDGRVVYGDTAPLWAGLLVVAHWLVARVGIDDWLLSGKLLTIAAAAFALSGVFASARALAGRWMPAERARLFAATMVLVVVTGPYFGYWAFSGMEALAGAGCVCWGAWVAAAGRITPQRFLAGAMLVGLAPLLRPELAIFSALLAILLLVRWFQRERKRSLWWASLIAGVVLAILPGMAWARYALVHFGSVLPTTNAAKRAGLGDSVAMRLLQVYGFGYPLLVAGLVLLAIWVVWWLVTKRTTSFAVSAAEGLVLLWAAMTVVFYLANHTLVQTRYVFVAAPAVLVVLFALAAKRWPAVYWASLLLTLGYGIVASAISTRPLVRNKVEIDRQYARLAAYVRALSPQAAVAQYSIGEAAFLSGHPVVDTGGITRPGVLAYLGDPNDGRLQAWVVAQGAGYEVIDHQPMAGATLVWSAPVPMTGWYLDPRRYRATERLELWKLRR